MTAFAPIELELATLEDHSAILPLMIAFNEVERIRWRPRAMGAALRRLLEEPALGMIVVARAEASATILAYGLATLGFDLEFAGVDAFITELFVVSECRRRGIGRQLLDSLVQRLRERDAKAVHLMVAKENSRARSLYEAHGFVATPRVMMTKRLDALG